MIRLNIINTIGIIIIMFYVSSIILAYSWVLVRNNSIENLNKQFKTLFSGIVTNLNFNINSAISVNDFAVEFMNDFTIYNGTFSEYINLSSIKNSTVLTNVAVYYNTSYNERKMVEDRLSFLSNKTIFISDLSPLDNKTLIPAQIRPYYCPIAFIAPITNYTGFDVCALPQFTELLKTINSTKLTIIPRQSAFSNLIVINFASKTYNGFTSVTIVLNNILDNIRQNIVNYDFDIDLSLSNKTFYSSCNKTCDTSFVNSANLSIINSDTIGINIYFKNVSIEYIPFVYIAFILLILDIVVIVFLSIIYLQKKRYEIADLMLGYVNHEIRNPLNCIKGLIEITIDDLNNNKIENLKNLHLLQDYQSENNSDNSEGDIKDLIIKIENLINNEYINSNLLTAKNACELLNHIVNDILDFKKLYDGKLIIIKSYINVNEFKKTMLNIITSKLSEKQIEYSFNSNGIDIIYSDKDRLMQIMLNFLTNAIKFTENGFIRVNLEKDMNNIKISVTDSGIGIANENKEKIFKPFEHIELVDSLRHGGIGLGLFLSKMLTDLLNGSIGFESTLGVGSTFWIKLPLK